MALLQTIRNWFSGPPPPKVRVLVVAPGREVATVLKGLSTPIVHQCEQDTSAGYWGVFVFEAESAGAMVAVLHGDARETRVELIGMGPRDQKGVLPAQASGLFGKQFPVVALDTA